MPCYLVERTYVIDAGAREFSANESMAERVCFAQNNARAGVVWLYSFMAPNSRKSFCLYEAPGPEALREAAVLNKQPIDRINEVRMLVPPNYPPWDRR